MTLFISSHFLDCLEYLLLMSAKLKDSKSESSWAIDKKDGNVGVRYLKDFSLSQSQCLSQLLSEENLLLLSAKLKDLKSVSSSESLWAKIKRRKCKS